MTYTVDFSNGTKTAITLVNNVVDNTTNIGLVGQGYKDYGEVVAEDLLHILENFANTTAPDKPVEGQLWYDSGQNQLKYYDDTIANSGNWKSIASITVQASAPTGVGETDGHFWLDNGTGALYLRYSGAWQAITTGGGGGSGTQIVARTRYDTSDILHNTIEVVVNGTVVSITSTDGVAWTPQNVGVNTEYDDNGTTLLSDLFSSVLKGINLNESGGYVFNGTATSVQNEAVYDNAIYDTSGGPTSFTATPSPAFTALVNGDRVQVRPNVTGTGGVNLAVNGLAAAQVKKYNEAGTAVSVGTSGFFANAVYDLEYQAGEWIVVGETVTAATEAQFLAKTGGYAVTPAVGWSAAQPKALVPGTIVDIDMAAGINWTLTISENTTFTFSNIYAGMTGSIALTQDVFGGHSVTMPASAVTENGAGVNISISPNALSLIQFFVIDGSTVMVTATPGLS